MKNYTELLSSLNFTNAVLDTIGALVLVMDRHGKIVVFNSACQTLSGYSEQEVVGRPPWDFLLPSEICEDVREMFSHLVAGDFPNKYEKKVLKNFINSKTVLNNPSL